MYEIKNPIIENSERIYEGSEKHNKNYLPIMMKVYEKGKMTPSLNQTGFSNSNLKVSKPRGFGLCFETIKPGKIIILAGGTGIFPFSDFIDLFFKETLLNENHPLSSTILKLNPIL